MLYFKYHTSVRPFTRSDALVTDVPFAWTRNPMYTGMLLVLSGEALLFGSLGPWLMVPVMWWILHRLFVLKEEEGMRIQFGQAYEDYCARVKRWV
jgi:protein-S-isoprenylcysteine O-methyltransferase Ste14